jgi:hypothetical protein
VVGPSAGTSMGPEPDLEPYTRALVVPVEMVFSAATCLFAG